MKVFFLLAVFSSIIFGYSENIRQGYVNCTACHISPNGGGILTAYGRSLSREIISTWGAEKETRFMYVVDPPEWLQLGGNVRFIQTQIDTPVYRQARFITMQADVEAGATYNKFQFVATLGKSNIENPPSFTDALVSRRHYALYKINDDMNVRAGRFFPAFGLLVSDHTLATRRGLGFDQGNETYNAEFSYLGETFDTFVTAIVGRPDKPELKRERGFALRGARNFNETYKVGAGYYYGHNEVGDRHLVGPYGILGFRKNLFALVELDLVKSSPGSRASTTGVAHYGRLNYEFFKGAHVYLTEDIYKGDLSDPSTTVTSFGIGAQWFPRPHLEVVAQYQKTKIWAVDPANYNDYIWLQLHFYP